MHGHTNIKFNSQFCEYQFITNIPEHVFLLAWQPLPRDATLARTVVIRKPLVWPVSRDSSVGIATHYGLDGPEIESRRGRDFRTRPGRPWVPRSPLYNRYQVFSGGKAAGAWR